MPEQLVEHYSDWRCDTVVEAAVRTIRNVALAGTASKNGYHYRENALRDAVPLYAGVPVFLDHPTRPQRPRDRSARDLAGHVENVRYDAQRLRGEIRTLDTEAGRTLLALAESNGHGVGMSHVVLAERSSDGRSVDRIVEVVSVDAVAFPATVTSFREQHTTEVPPESRVEPLTVHPTSLERLLGRIDAELPRHLRQIAGRAGLPAGRGVRVGVFPGRLLVEWQAAGGLPERYLLAWHFEGDGVRFGETLVPESDWPGPSPGWGDGASEVDQLRERLQTVTAERDRVASRLEAARSAVRPAQSARRTMTANRGDDAFVASIRRR